MSLSPFDSFQSRFVTYLLNFPRKSTNYPDHGHHGDLPLPGKIPMVEPGIEPGLTGNVSNIDIVSKTVVRGN